MMKLARVTRLGVLIGMAAGLGACSEARDVFSFGQSAPDEFAVVSRAPLAIPPSYSLEPPRPGAPRPQEGTSSDRARSAMTGGEQAQTGTVASASAAEAMLLSRAGAAEADDSVRDAVDRAAGSVSGDENFVQRVLFWQGQSSRETIVDPEREAERLENAQREGRPLGEGQIPTIERREGGILSDLF